jgi:3-dehydroquinate dehydratase-1
VAQTTKAPHFSSTPCILGVVNAEMLARRRWPDALWQCGGVELRADGLPPDDIAGTVADFDAEKGRRGFAGPVFFTLRLRRDGGAWEDGAAAERSAVWESLPPGTCDWADLEIEEIARVTPTALDSLQSSGVKILLSHHAFSPEEPPAWDALLDAMRGFRPDGVKFAVTLRDRAHAEDLLRLARRVAAEFPAAGVLGMGAAGSLTRLISPLRGCPFTYGYLGAEQGAPGQLPAAAMRAFFAEAAGAHPAADAAEAVWLDWAEALWAQVARGAHA